MAKGDIILTLPRNESMLLGKQPRFFANKAGSEQCSMYTSGTPPKNLMSTSVRERRLDDQI